MKTFVILLLVSVVCATPFTAEQARQRLRQHRADRVPVDNLVAQVTERVRQQAPSEECYKHSFDTSSTDWRAITAKPDVYAPMLRKAFVALGYEVKELTTEPVRVICDCAKGTVACTALCYDEPHVTLCWGETVFLGTPQAQVPVWQFV